MREASSPTVHIADREAHVRSPMVDSVAIADQGKSAGPQLWTEMPGVGLFVTRGLWARSDVQIVKFANILSAVPSNHPPGVRRRPVDWGGKRGKGGVQSLSGSSPRGPAWNGASGKESVHAKA